MDACLNKALLRQQTSHLALWRIYNSKFMYTSTNNYMMMCTSLMHFISINEIYKKCIQSLFMVITAWMFP